MITEENLIEALEQIALQQPVFAGNLLHKQAKDELVKKKLVTYDNSGYVLTELGWKSYLDINGLTIDNLIRIIINNIGVKLPIYDYNKQKFIAIYPQNEKNGKNIKGIEVEKEFNSYFDACFCLYKLYKLKLL